MDLVESAQHLLSGDSDTWLEALEDLSEARGYFEPLGESHTAILTDEGSKLLVTFETADRIRNDTDDDLPLGFSLVRENGWSNLCMLTRRQTWFRDPAVYKYFDRLVDDGFFEDFDHVVFLGEGMCGYAAAAYSVTAPGATVIAIQPQATLDPRVTEWDMRFPSMRRTSFTDRYGYAPDMIEAAGRAFVIYDPEEEMDAMHATLFSGSNVTKLRCRHMGRRIGLDLSSMDILQALVDRAGTGALTGADFFRLYRARRDYSPWLRQVLGRLEDDDRLVLAGALCRNVVARMNGPRFRRKLEAINKTLAERGMLLPERAAPVTGQHGAGTRA